MPLPRLFSVPGQPDRRRAIILLVLANAPTLVTMNAIYVLARMGTIPPGWLLLALAGCITGQMVTLAYWFSLSRDTLWFRLGILFTTVCGSTLGTTLAGIYWQLQFYYQQDPADRPFVNWFEVVWLVVWSFLTYSVLCLALFFLAYAILLPIRRLRGIALGSAEPDGTGSPIKRQFQIYEWMIWTVIVAAPLVMVRIVTMGVQSETERLLVYGSLFLFAFSPLVAGWPVFRSALAERYPLLWTMATFAALTVFGWLACEATFWINLDRLTGQPGVFSSMFSFWPFETFVVSAAAAVSLNAFALRWLGFRLRRGERQERAVRSAGALADSAS